MNPRRLVGTFTSTGFLFLWIAQLSSAAILDIATSADPANLQVGVKADFRVDLSGLAPGEEFDFLSATVDMDFSLLGVPTVPTAGPIVTDDSGFLSASNPGQADGFFDSLFAITNSTISSDGTFFEFSVTPVAPGQGTMFFSFVDGGFAGPPPTKGPDLAYTVQGNPIPEPTSVVAWGLGLASVGAFVYAYRSRRKRPGSECGLP